MISMVKPAIRDYQDALTNDTGCTGYFFSPTPLVIETVLFQKLNTAVPLLLELLDQSAYWDHCIQQEHWKLPIQPMKTTDFTGCADFLLTTNGAKLIEMNINLPGKVGLMQTLAESARLYLGEPENDWMNLAFNEELLATISAAIPTKKPIALIVSHLQASKKHQAHYRYFSELLNKQGLKTTVVPANELSVTETGCYWKGLSFEAFINLVIPFVWESHPIEFTELTALWKQHPDPFFPNPTGGMYGTKDLLSYLSSKRDLPNSDLWSEFVLGAQLLTEFESIEQVLENHPLHKMVLKPLKDYDTKGVYVQPDFATVKRIFEERQNDYMVQEFTDSLQLPFQLPTEETVISHSVIFRIFFASKKPMGYQGYFIQNSFNGEYYTAPVMVK